MVVLDVISTFGYLVCPILFLILGYIYIVFGSLTNNVNGMGNRLWGSITRTDDYFLCLVSHERRGRHREREGSGRERGEGRRKDQLFYSC
jgi:hypothetical protein